MAENLPISDLSDEVDRMLDEVLGHERYTTSRERFLLLLAEKRDSLSIDTQDLFISYLSYLSENDSVTGDIWSRRHWILPESGIYHLLTGTPIALSRSGEEQHPPRQNLPQDELEKLKTENSTLRNRISMLQKEVLSFYDTVQFAAVSVLFFCALSVTTWLTVNVPLLNPLISIIGIMAAPFFIAMAWIGKKELARKNNQNENNPELLLK